MIPRSFNRWIVLPLLLTVVAVACSWAGPPSATPGPTATRQAEAADGPVALTVYNQGSALVRDQRQFELASGMNEIAFDDVAASIDPTSVLFRPLSNPGGTQVLEQNYQYDLVGSSNLLQKYLGESISVLTKDGSQYRGELLSGNGDLILQTNGGEVVVIKLAEVQQYSFPQLPEGLISKPTLQWRLMANRSGQQDFEVTYLTGGIDWQADYVVLLTDDDSAVDLDGWVTLNNSSGASYHDAQLKLVAGDLQRIQQQQFAADAEMMEEAMPTRAAVEQREFFEYHLYEIPRPVTVLNNESKQIEFVSASGVPAEKFFVYDGLGCRGGNYSCNFYGYPQTDPGYGVATHPKVNVMVQFDSEDVDADLPRGRVRLYQEDVDGAGLLIGEDRIDHTPKGEQLRLYVGDAFDIVGERIRTDFVRPGEDSLEETFEITLRNHKDEAVEVRVIEHLFRWSEWRILNASADHTKLDSHTAEFRIQIPANGEQSLTYTARYFWP
ncbi:MAG: DUF4139 domain-containing protein [Anaerolineales bacterium]